MCMRACVSACLCRRLSSQSLQNEFSWLVPIFKILEVKPIEASRGRVSPTIKPFLVT